LQIDIFDDVPDWRRYFFCYFLQNQTGNHSGLSSPINGGYQQQLQHSTLRKRASPLENIFHLPVQFGNLVGNIITDTQDVLDRVNPLNRIFSGNNLPVTKGNSARNIADSFTRKPIVSVTTTIPKNTSPVLWDPLGNLLRGAEGVFDSALGIKPQTTPSAHTGATVAPPAGGHGRGVPAVLFNIHNILENILEVVGAILHLNEYPEPGYIISKVQSSLQSLEALKDIYLQKDMQGGIGDIPKHIWAILQSVRSLSDTFNHNDSGNILTVIGSGQTLLRNLGELKDDFEEPVSTTPVPGGIIGGFLRGLSMILPHNNTNTIKEINQTSLQQKYGAFGNVIWNAGKLIDALKDIDETLQKYHPNNTLLQFIEKAEELAKLFLTNNTFDDENILDVVQKIWFPGMTLAQMIEYFGKTLKQAFPKFNIAQVIGDLMQQEFIVDLGLNILVRGVNFLRFGNIKDSFIYPIANVSDILLGRDINSLFAFGIDVLEKTAETVEWFLKTYHATLDQLIFTLKGGADLRHATTKAL
jgi:hypothetical protein